MEYEKLYDLLKDLMIDYLSDLGVLEQDMDETSDIGENDETVQAIDTLIDYLESKEG